MRFRPPPRARKPGGARPVSADVDPAVLSERAALVSRGLLAARTPLAAISKAAQELDAIERTSQSWPEVRVRLTAWAGQEDSIRRPRLARLLSACAAAARRPEDLRAQVKFLRRISVISAFSAALGVGTALEKERAARQCRAKAIRNNHH
jgi:hypothetical protein